MIKFMYVVFFNQKFKPFFLILKFLEKSLSWFKASSLKKEQVYLKKISLLTQKT